jgi:MHS family proline/betaine transporter-like MFS transporter
MDAGAVASGSPHRTGMGWAEWRVVLLSSFGGALEFYDFVIYSMFAQYIGATFFPARDPLVSLILSFAVFSVGYLARPIGGVILSHFGDRYGRRPVFITTILVMSGSTVCMGLLPGYATWGVAASVLMVLLRLIQGFCLGGELPGAITYVTETTPRHAGFAAGMIFFCVNSGVGLASLLSLGVHEALSPDQVAAWGWRIGFLAGGVFGLLSFWLRLSLEETREFASADHVPSKKPFAELMRTHPGRVIVGIGALAATGGFNGLLFAMPAMLPSIMGYTAVEAIVAQNILLAVLSCGLLVAAWAGDRIPRRYLLGLGALLAVLFGHGWFVAADARSIPLPVLGALAALVASFYSGSFAAIAADLFPTRVRFSGIAVVLNVSFSLFSGVAPLVATTLVKASGSPAAAGWYMVGCAALTLIASLFVHRYDGMLKHMTVEKDAYGHG